MDSKEDLTSIAVRFAILDGVAMRDGSGYGSRLVWVPGEVFQRLSVAEMEAYLRAGLPRDVVLVGELVTEWGHTLRLKHEGALFGCFASREWTGHDLDAPTIRLTPAISAD